MKLRSILVPVMFALTVGVANAQKADQLKVSGFVKKDGLKAKSFVVAGNKGTYKVDASRAKVHDEKGKSFDLSKLTPGSNVTVVGKAKGKDSIEADDVEVNFLRAPGAPKKADDKDDEKAPRRTRKKSDEKTDTADKKTDEAAPADKKDESKPKRKTRKKSDDKTDSADKKTDETKPADKKEDEKKPKKKKSKKDDKTGDEKKTGDKKTGN